MVGEQSQSDGTYKIAEVSVKDLEFLEKNARYMSQEMFRNLVDNIKRDGALSSMPLCWKHGDKYRVLSGNHRCAAAIEAGLEKVMVMYIDKDLSRQEQIAIQISHNAIDCKDDLVILKELWGELEDIDLKYYAGLDDKLLEDMEKISMSALVDAKLDFRSVTFLFLPNELKKLEAVVKQLSNYVTENSTIYVNRFEDFKRLLRVQSKTQASYDIKNSATSLMIILDIFNRHQEDLINGYMNENEELIHKNKVPLSSIFGDDYISADSAIVLKKALEKSIDSGMVKSKCKLDFLKILADKYLTGE